MPDQAKSWHPWGPLNSHFTYSLNIVSQRQLGPPVTPKIKCKLVQSPIVHNYNEAEREYTARNAMQLIS